MHKDHLGSIDLVTDEAGLAGEARSFDAWGRPRNADWTPATIDPALAETPRGFTDHEHIQTVGLIHMNGRVQDPVLGRFVSPDPSDALNPGVGFNRYSYTGNNPLSLTDPSGFIYNDPNDPIRREFALGLGTQFINSTYEMFDFISRLGITWHEVPPREPLIERPAEPTFAFEAGEWAAVAGELAIGARAVYKGLKEGVEWLTKRGDEVVAPPKAPPNPWGSKGKPDHQAKVDELADLAESELKTGERVLRERQIQGYPSSKRRPDVQIVDADGNTRKIFEAERCSACKRNKDREAEYDKLGIENVTHGLGDVPDHHP